MDKYTNTSNVTLVVVVDNTLKVIEPNEIFEARSVVYTPNIAKVKPKAIKPEKTITRKSKKNADKAEN